MLEPCIEMSTDNTGFDAPKARIKIIPDLVFMRKFDPPLWIDPKTRRLNVWNVAIVMSEVAITDL